MGVVNGGDLLTLLLASGFGFSVAYMNYINLKIQHECTVCIVIKTQMSANTHSSLPVLLKQSLDIFRLFLVLVTTPE